MAWLLRGGDVLAALEERRKGWQTSITGAVIVRRPAFVQTVTPSAAADLDTAWCVPQDLSDGRSGYRVKHIALMHSRRVSMPRVVAGALVVAPGGTFDRWRLHVGDCLEVRGG